MTNVQWTEPGFTVSPLIICENLRYLRLNNEFQLPT